MMSAELTIGFDSRYFVPHLHLPVASASKHCLRQVMKLERKGVNYKAIRRKLRGVVAVAFSVRRRAYGVECRGTDSGRAA